MTSPVDPPSCPTCGAPMKERTNKRTGEVFWGCTEWPRCNGTRDVLTDDATSPLTRPVAHRDDPVDRLPSERAQDNDRRRWRH